MAGRKCVRKSRRTGLPCQNWAMKEQTQCRMHGGNTEAKKRAARKRMVLKRAQNAAELLGGDVEPVTDSAAELSALLGRVKVIEQLLWTRLHDDQDPASLDVYGDAVDRLGKFLSEAVKLGLLDKAVAVQQAQAQKLADAFLDTVREQRAWLSLLLTERGIAPTDAYNLTSDFERVSREKFAGRMRALPTESADQ